MQINSKTIDKKEKRLLQNRKSALKCRIKKEQACKGFKGQSEELKDENLALREEVSTQIFLISS
jgi:hypothetical protein